MFDSLRKKFEEVVADINPFDGGQTAQTIRQNRDRPAPAQTISKQNRPTQFQSGVNSFNTSSLKPKVQAPIHIDMPEPVTQTPLPKVLNNSGMVNVPNGAKQEKPNLPAPQQQQVPSFNPQAAPVIPIAKGTPNQKDATGPTFNDVGKFLFGNTAKTANTVGGGVAIAGTLLSDMLTNAITDGDTEKKIHDFNMKNIENIDRNILHGGGGFLGEGGFTDSKGFAEMNPLDALKKGVAAGAETAAEIYGPGKGTALAMRGGKLLPKVIEGGTSGALAGAAGSAGGQYLEDGTIDPIQVAKDAAISGAMGAGIPAVARATSKLVPSRVSDEVPSPTKERIEPTQQEMPSPTRPSGLDIPSSVASTTDTPQSRTPQPTTRLVPRNQDDLGIASFDRNIPEATPIRQIIDEKRTGEQFSKPRDSFAMTQGKLDQEQGGTILSESANQRKRMMINPNGVNEMIVETKQSDGSWVRSTEREPVVAHLSDQKGIDALANNEELNQAASTAIKEGRAIHLYADKGSGDPTSRGAAVHEFDPEKHIIDGGFVRDANTNQILGNHITVDDSGMHMNIGKKMVDMEALTGDPSKWKNVNHIMSTFDRIIEEAAPDDATYRKVRSFLIDHKQGAEADMRVDLSQFRNKVKDSKDTLLAIKPSGVNKKEYMSDIFHYAERKLAQEKGLADGKKLSQEQILEAKYGPNVADHVKAFDEWARQQYDSLLDRTNEVLRRFGHDEVQKRQNYMTHLQEDSLWDKIGIGEDLYRDLTSGVQGEMNAHNRGSLPGNIAGLTEKFAPTRRYNPFHQARRGKDSMTDPFKAMDAYGEAALFNIHMTESAVRARSLESVFRAAEEITNKDMLKQVNENLQKTLNESLGGTRNDTISAFQEYANTLAGKSNHIDRPFQDTMGKKGRIVLRVARMLQKIAAQSSIAGNVSVTTAQALNLPNNIGTNGAANVIKGIGRTLKDVGFNGEPKLGSPASRSNFLKVRYTDAQSKVDKSIYQKTNDVVSNITLMPAVERAFVEMSWNSSYEAALKKGFSGRSAVREADRITERIVGGRGIGDQPDLYRSTVGKTFLQYTLEVNAALKNIRNDMTPMGVAKYAAAVFAMNYLMQNVTGRAPLPDFVGAGIDTVKDFNDWSDKNKDGKPDETVGDKVAQGAQRIAAQGVKMSPQLSAGVNTLLPKDAKEAVFGADSDTARYDGTPAGSSVVAQGLMALSKLFGGNFQGAASDALSVVPFGSQIRKTTEGIDAMGDGYAKNSAGKATTAIDQNDPISWVKAALFGKNAIPEVKAFYDNGQNALGEKQSKVLSEIEKAGGNTKGYVDSVQSRRAGGDATSNLPAGDDEVLATAKVNLDDGTWNMDDGIIRNKSGEIQRGFYKDLAASAGATPSNEAYQAFVMGYGLDPALEKKSKKGSATKTGNSLKDSLLSKDDERDSSKSKASTAISLFSNDKKYDGVPDWAKERFYKEAGFTKDDVQYASLAAVDKDTKVAEYYKPLFEQQGHDALLNELYAGRKKSISNDYIMAQDSIITQLVNEGYISKDEGKNLKATKFEKDGKKVAAKPTGTGSRGGKGKKAKKGKFDYKLGAFDPKDTSSSSLRALLNKAKLKN